MNLDARQRLQDTVLRFATAVDTLDFDLYLATFADECLYDVSSFTGTPASVVKARARGTGKVTRVTAAHAMKPSPQASAALASRRAPSMSPRPIARPTRTAAAALMPNGTMYVSDARLMVISCPASGTVPSIPMRARAPPKATTSKNW